MAFGISLASPSSPAWAISLLAVAAVLLLLTRRPSAAGFHLTAAGTAAAAIAGFLSADRHDPAAGADALAEVRGVLSEAPQRHEVPAAATISGTSGDYTTAALRVRDSTDPRIRRRSVLLAVPGHAPNLVSGMEVRATGRLRPVPPPANPGETRPPHDWRLTVRNAEAVEAADDAGPTFRERVRGGVAATLRANLPPPQSGLAEALALGRRDRVPDALRDAFRDTGTGHLLAISGTHVGIVTALTLLAVSRLTRSVAGRAAAVAACVLLFGWLVESRASVTRSVLFGTLAAAGVAGGRRVDPFALLSVAAVVVMAGDPGAIADPGTQLSFTAVAAILIASRGRVVGRMTPPALRREDAPLHLRAARRLIEFLLWSTVIWLAVLPLTWLHFGRLAAWAPVMTVLLLPLVTAAMVSQSVALAADLWVPLPGWAWWPANASLSAVVGLVSAAARADGLNWSVAGPPAWSIAAAYGTAVVAFTTAGRAKAWSRRVLLTALLVACLTSAWPRPSPAMRLTSLSVGHGLCTVVQTAAGRTILLDIGSMTDSDRTAFRVEDALRELGVRSVQTVFLSHADRDHYGSLRSLLGKMTVGEVVIHPSFRDDPPPPLTALLAELDARDIPLRYTTAGDRYDYGSVQATVLHPDNNSRFKTDNEESLVVRLRAAGRTVLSTGDIEDLGQQWLMTLPPRPVDVLLAPHHGAVDANTRRFAGWCRPRAVVCSSGHDRADALSGTYAGAAIFQTLTDGAVTLTVEEDGSAVLTGYRSRRRTALPAGRPPEVVRDGVPEPLLD